MVTFLRHDGVINPAGPDGLDHLAQTIRAVAMTSDSPEWVTFAAPGSEVDQVARSGFDELVSQLAMDVKFELQANIHPCELGNVPIRPEFDFLAELLCLQRTVGLADGFVVSRIQRLTRLVEVLDGFPFLAVGVGKGTDVEIREPAIDRILGVEMNGFRHDDIGVEG